MFLLPLSLSLFCLLEMGRGWGEEYQNHTLHFSSQKKQADHKNPLLLPRTFSSKTFEQSCYACLLPEITVIIGGKKIIVKVCISFPSP